MKLFIKISLTSTIILALALLFNSCKKYPEDERRFLALPEHRISNATSIYKFLINDQDSSNSQTYKYAMQNYYFFKLTSKHGGELDGQYYYSYWEFDRKKNNIKFTNFRWDPTLAFSSILPRGNSTWEIRKLTKEEFKIRSYINGNKYEIAFH